MHLPKKKESEQAIRLKGVKTLKIAELHRSEQRSINSAERISDEWREKDQLYSSEKFISHTVTYLYKL
jgi:hypothetical protein